MMSLGVSFIELEIWQLFPAALLLEQLLWFLRYVDATVSIVIPHVLCSVDLYYHLSCIMNKSQALVQCVYLRWHSELVGKLLLQQFQSGQHNSGDMSD